MAERRQLLYSLSNENYVAVPNRVSSALRFRRFGPRVRATSYSQFDPSRRHV